MKNDYKKYLIVFFITLSLFLTALYISNVISGKKISELQTIQDKISIDILSSETQFSLLEESSCKDVENNTVLSKELATLGERIESSSGGLGDDEEILSLKRYYSLLEIKDYLLMKKVTERCKQKTIFILYFYTTEEKCSECTKEGYVLTALREKYPELRVYSFDYNLDLSAVRTLISIYKVEDTKLPAMIMNGKLVTGFKSVEEVEEILPELKTILPAEEDEIQEPQTTPKSNTKVTPPKPEENSDAPAVETTEGN